jgi:hypothetical protein
MISAKIFGPGTMRLFAVVVFWVMPPAFPCYRVYAKMYCIPAKQKVERLREGMIGLLLSQLTTEGGGKNPNKTTTKRICHIIIYYRRAYQSAALLYKYSTRTVMNSAFSQRNAGAEGGMT